MQLVYRRIFWEDGGGSGSLHRVAVIIAGIDRDPDDSRLRPSVLDVYRGIDPVHSRHIDVHDYHAWMKLTHQLYRLRTIPSFCDDMEILIGIQYGTKPLSNHRVIIHKQHLHHGPSFFLRI